MRGIRVKPFTEEELEFRKLIRSYRLTETQIASFFGYRNWQSFYNSTARGDMMKGIVTLIQIVSRNIILKGISKGRKTGNSVSNY